MFACFPHLTAISPISLVQLQLLVFPHSCTQFIINHQLLVLPLTFLHKFVPVSQIYLLTSCMPPDCFPLSLTFCKILVFLILISFHPSCIWVLQFMTIYDHSGRSCLFRLQLSIKYTVAVAQWEI